MPNTKKSLSVAELADKIKSVMNAKDCKGMPNAKQIMAELRKTFTFSKDKWAKARKMVASSNASKKGNKDTQTVKKPVVASVTVECKTFNTKRDAVADAFYDAIVAADEDADEMALRFVRELTEKSLKAPGYVLLTDLCPLGAASFYRLLDSAQESGMLEKFIGYKLTDNALKTFQKDAAKKKVASKKKAKK